MIHRPHSSPTVPWQIADAVELWARQQGRHATMEWAPGAKCFVIEFDLKDGDPRLKGWQEGRLQRKPTEKVFLHRPTGDGHYEAMEVEEMGASGVVDMLDKGNLMSGRGEYKNLNAAVQAVEQQNQRLREQIQKAAVENARLRARDERRWILDEPFVEVTATLENN